MYDRGYRQSNTGICAGIYGANSETHDDCLMVRHIITLKPITTINDLTIVSEIDYENYDYDYYDYDDFHGAVAK